MRSMRSSLNSVSIYQYALGDCVCETIAGFTVSILFFFSTLSENMIYKGLDDEEATFLQFVAEKKAQLDTEQKQAENEEILAFRVRERQCTTLASSFSLPSIFPFDHF